MTLDDLITPLSIEESRAAFYSTLASTGVTTTNWKPGAVVRTIVTGFAILVAALSALVSLIARGGYLELATGRWLTLRAKDTYDVERREAGFASGIVKVSNSQGGVYPFDPGDLIVRNSVTKALYRNVETITIGALAANVAVAVEALEAGSASSALMGEITELETQFDGLSVTNDETLVGLDAEEDPELRAKCSEKLGSLSPMGPPDAYAFAAKNARLPDGTPVGVTRTRTVKDGFGNVFTYVATASGAVSGTEDDINSPLGAVSDAIQRNAAGLNDTAFTISADPVTVNVSYEIWLYNTSGMQVAQIQAVIAASLVQFFAEQPIGGNIIEVGFGQLYTSAIQARIGGVRTAEGTPLSVIRVVISDPATDSVPLGISQVPVLGSITGAIVHQLPPPGSA